MEVCGGCCGITNLRGSELPAPAKKLKLVNLEPGEFKVRLTAADCLPERKKDRSKRWVNLEADDLKYFAGETPDRAVGRVVAPVISGAPCRISATTNYNRFAAVMCRMFADHPAPRKLLWKMAAIFYDTILPDFHNRPAEMDRMEWLLSMPKERQGPLLEAMTMLDENGWFSKFRKFHAFIKDELLPFFDKNSDGLIPLCSALSRLIYAPHDVTHVIAGPKIKPYLGWLKAQWHCDNWIFYASTSPDKIQHWLDTLVARGPLLYFWSDYSQFELTHSVETWEFVETLYSQHAHDPLFKEVLDAWRAPQGDIGPFRFKGRIMNASGRDDTAFANALLNGFAMAISVASAWFQIPLLDLKLSDLIRIQSELSLSVCGDDALGGLPSVSEERSLQFVEDCKENLRAFGFNAKMFCSFRLEDCVYLAHRPTPVGGRWYWGKTLGRCLYKLGFQRGVAGDPKAFFAGICKMHEVCSRHVPVLSDICTVWAEANAGCKVTHYKFDPNRPWEAMGSCSPGYYDESTLESLARAYTVDSRPCRADLSMNSVFVTARDFHDLIDYVRNAIDGRPCVLDHWLLRHMVWVDEQ